MDNHKNNKVELHDKWVVKHYNSEAAFKAELYAYLLNLPMLPKLLDHSQKTDLQQDTDRLNSDTSSKWLKLERIIGKPYLDEHVSFNCAQLGVTIAGFHKATYNGNYSLCHIDNQPNNIIATNSSFYLIDFEHSSYHHPERDISHLLLFWAADFTHEIFAKKMQDFLSGYLEILKLETNRWQYCYQESVTDFDTRRRRYSKPSGCMPLSIQTANRDLLRNCL